MQKGNSKDANSTCETMFRDCTFPHILYMCLHHPDFRELEPEHMSQLIWNHQVFFADSGHAFQPVNVLRVDSFYDPHLDQCRQQTMCCSGFGIVIRKSLKKLKERFWVLVEKSHIKHGFGFGQFVFFQIVINACFWGPEIRNICSSGNTSSWYTPKITQTKWRKQSIWKRNHNRFTNQQRWLYFCIFYLPSNKQDCLHILTTTIVTKT